MSEKITRHQWPELNPKQPVQTDIDLGKRLDLLFVKMDRLDDKVIKLVKLIEAHHDSI